MLFAILSIKFYQQAKVIGGFRFQDSDDSWGKRSLEKGGTGVPIVPQELHRPIQPVKCTALCICDRGIFLYAYSPSKKKKAYFKKEGDYLMRSNNSLGLQGQSLLRSPPITEVGPPGQLEAAGMKMAMILPLQCHPLRLLPLPSSVMTKGILDAQPHHK